MNILTATIYDQNRSIKGTKRFTGRYKKILGLIRITHLASTYLVLDSLIVVDTILVEDVKLKMDNLIHAFGEISYLQDATFSNLQHNGQLDDLDCNIYEKFKECPLFIQPSLIVICNGLDMSLYNKSILIVNQKLSAK